MGNMRPDTTAGQRLLAHELTHVTQQRFGGTARSKGCLPPRPAGYPMPCSYKSHAVSAATWPTGGPMKMPSMPPSAAKRRSRSNTIAYTSSSVTAN